MKTSENTFFCWLIANLEIIICLPMLLALFLRWEGNIPDLDVLKEMTLLKIIGLFIAIASIYIAVYSWIHFDETVSRRVLWRNSRVALFEMRLLYVFSRLINAVVALAVIALLLLLTFWGDWKTTF